MRGRLPRIFGVFCRIFIHPVSGSGRVVFSETVFLPVIFQTGSLYFPACRESWKHLLKDNRLALCHFCLLLSAICGTILIRK